MSKRRTRYLDIAKTSPESNYIDSAPPEQQITFSVPTIKRAHQRPTRNYGSWEYSYFRELLELRNIVATELSRCYPELYEYFRSVQFMKMLTKFIFQHSSTDITILEPLTDKLREDYTIYKS